MAIISGSLGAVAGVGKLLAGGLTKKKIMAGAGNAVKGAVKNRLGRKKKGGKPGAPGGDEGGSMIQSPGGAIVPTSPLLSDIVIPYPAEPAKNRPKPVGRVDFNSISEQLQSIVALTAAIEQVTGKSIKTKNKIKNTNKKNKEKAAKRDKENRLAGAAGGALGFLGSKLGQVAEASGIMQFLSNILTGFIVVKLLPMLPGILNGIKFIGGNLHYFFLGFKGTGLAMTAGIKEFGKRMPPLIEQLKEVGKPVTQVFAKAGQRIKNVFANLSKVVPNFITTGLNAVGNAARGVSEGVKNLTRTITGNTRGAQLGASAKGLEKLTGTAGKGSQQAMSGALKMRRIHGNEAARMYKGLIDNGMSNAKASKYVMNQIKAGKLTSAPLKGSLAGGLKGSKVFKGGVIKTGKRAVIKYLGKGPIVKKALRNIPIVGPLIVGVTSLLSGEPAAQALFKVGGTLVGGILGAFLPIPILGPIIGEIIGEYVGDLMYVLLMGGGPAAVMDRMKQDITNVMSAGSMAMDWVGRGFGRFMRGIPKLQMPGIVSWMFPENMRSIPNPIWLLNPMNIFDKMSLFWKAFFTDDSISKGREEVKQQNQQPPSGGGGNKPLRSNFPKGTKGTKMYKAAYAKWKAQNEPSEAQNPDPPPNASEEGDNNESEPIIMGERPGSDASGLKSVPASSASSKTEYNATGGDKNRKMFLHWTAGHHNQPFSYYHTVFLGDGKAVRYTPYGQDKYSHTKGANKGSIGLSLAAMKDGGENQKSWAVPPTAAQIDSMVTEAAQIALDWGWDASTVDRNVMTHGEWERYATRNGVLPAPAQRWDLDKLKPSDPRIDTSKVMSHGGNTLRAKIKAKMKALKSGGPNNEENQQPQSNPNPPPPATVAKLQGPGSQSKLAVLAYGTNEWGMSRSYIVSKTKDLIKRLMDKGYKVIVVPPSPKLVVNANPKGKVEIKAPYAGVTAAAAEIGCKIHYGEYAKNDPLGNYVHLVPSHARSIKSKYKPDIVVGDSNAALINGGQSATAKDGSSYDAVAGMVDGLQKIEPTNTQQPPGPTPQQTQPQEQLVPQTQQPEGQQNPNVTPVTPKAGDATPKQLDLSNKTDEELKGMLDPTMSGAKNPAVFSAAQQARQQAKAEGLTQEQTERKVLEATVQASQGNNQAENATPKTQPQQPQMSSPSQPSSVPQSVQRQASYDQPGGGQPSPVVLPAKTPPQIPSGGGGSKIVPVGSGNVLNSYYKAQLLGFLYKQG